MPKATSQKRLNRDHARQQQRPMVEEEVIAAQLEAEDEEVGRFVVELLSLTTTTQKLPLRPCWIFYHCYNASYRRSRGQQ